MTTLELSDNIKNLTLDDRTTPQPESTIATVPEAHSEAPIPTKKTDLLPPFSRSAASKISEDFLIVRRLSNRYLMPSLYRDLVLGWPAPSDERMNAYLNRYRNQYHLKSIQDDAYRFVSLLRQHLRCPEIAVERCLPHHVTDPDPNGSEVTRSFDCVGISTTDGSRNLSPTKVTEAQYCWLVEFFGAPPVWYWYFQPRHIM
ncbi:hypothetical protein FOMPIDRAFT_1020125 [Fomitopsis schrenkii]|uniref:Uncharacterized protein n=1 Tax=Fomitopsis schrenkii TaxID=2126942 RepID=S8DSX1_FOMSC|nr:hypothetical protein FOMPIDRAFT_1020125 [Fomitopsis schrenkii]